MVRKHTQNKRPIYVAAGFLVVFILVIMIINAIRSTLFFTKKDRINLVIYGKHTTYYSLGINTEGDYAVTFPEDLKIQVPGGYGDYRVGALGKLVSLENKPEIIQNTFSLATYSFTDYYFYTKSDEVYYGTQNDLEMPTAKMIWSSGSNANMVDKLYLILYFLNKKPQDFHLVPVHTEKNPDGEEVYAAGEFEKMITGYLFQQTYRNEQKSVQILYADQYVNADRVGRMLEGNGIKVGDISQDPSTVKGCIVKEASGPPSYTAMSIAATFHCRWETGKTDIYDILFELGDREKDWQIK